MLQDLVVDIDSSTTATKAAAWTRAGEAVAEGRTAIPLMNPRPGHFEQDPKAWWQAPREALRGLWRHANPQRITALSVSDPRETFALFDAEGQALRPGILWLGERAREERKRFATDFGKERVHGITGKPPDVTPCLYSFPWLKRHETEVRGQSARTADVRACLTFCLTGKWATSLASANPLDILDMETGVWSKALLEALDLGPDRLPNLCVR